MGVYINMEMPKDGSCIQIVIDDDGKVYPSVEKCILKMGSIAKAVPVPPHGRLIDADLIMEKLKESCRTVSGDDGDIPWCSGLSIVADYIESAPTIIPASEEGI